MDVLIIAGNARSLIANRGELIREMKVQGLTVAAAVPTADLLPEVSSLGIDIYPIVIGRTGINPIQDFKAFWSLRGLIKKLKPTIVFGYTVKPVIYGSLAAKSAGVTRIYSMITGLGHVFTTETARTRRLRWIISLLYRAGLSCNQKVFFQNPDDRQEFVDRGILQQLDKAIRTYGSGVDIEHFSVKPLPAGSIFFLFIGRLLTEKGVAEYCEAARQVKERYPKARFLCVGPYDPGLPHSCAQEDLEYWKAEDVVEFIGSVPDVRPWIEQSSVFVLPSYREGTPRSVLEAMSMGRPIITTDAPGCRETVVEGENGYLVAPRESAPLVLAMESFLEHPELIARMGTVSRQLVEQNYDVRKVNKVILKAMELA